ALDLLGLVVRRDVQVLLVAAEAVRRGEEVARTDLHARASPEVDGGWILGLGGDAASDELVGARGDGCLLALGSCVEGAGGEGDRDENETSEQSHEGASWGGGSTPFGRTTPLETPPGATFSSGGEKVKHPRTRAFSRGSSGAPSRGFPCRARGGGEGPCPPAGQGPSPVGGRQSPPVGSPRVTGRRRSCGCRCRRSRST